MGRRKDDTCSSFRDARNPGEHYCGLPEGHHQMHECVPFDGVRWRLSKEERMSFADEIRQAEKDGAVGGGVFKPQEGKNVIRIVAGPLRSATEYEGKTKVRWLVLVIDRADGLVKPYFMPHSVAKMIRDLQQSDDYAFEKTPMPYDITLNAKGAGTIDVEYGVVAARKNSDITPEETVLIAAFGDLADYQHKIAERKNGARTFNPEELPV